MDLPTTKEDYAEEKLSAEEEAEACRLFRVEKHRKRLIREWNEKISSQVIWKTPDARGMYDELRHTKSQTGKPFQVNDGNRDVIFALCLYFAGDLRFNAFGKDFNLEKGIMLMGTPGVGKSHLMNFFIKNPHASYTIPTCKSIAEKYKNNWAQDEMSTIEFYSSLRKAEVDHPFNQQELGTCFGDLGTENDSNSYGNKRNVMEEIIFSRYEAKLPFKYTHITTNLDKTMIEGVYGERFLDRLREMCNVLVIKCQSFR